MSNSTTFGETKIQKIRFIAVEHGVSHITLSIIESNPRMVMEMLLTANEAQKLAQDILRRYSELML